MWGKIDLTAYPFQIYKTGLANLLINNTGDGTNIILYKNASVLNFGVNKEEKSISIDDVTSMADKRIYLPGNVRYLNIVPRLPDNPLLLCSKKNIVILPNRKTLFFIKVPSFIEITSDKNQGTLIEYPSIPLSNTWFGSEFKGSLCYTVNSEFEQNIDINEDLSPYIICTLEIENKSESILNFNRIYYEVDYLKLFKGVNNLWSNPSKIEYINDDDKIGKLIYFDKIPEYDNAAQLLSMSRKQLKHIIWKIKKVV